MSVRASPGYGLEWSGSDLHPLLQKRLPTPLLDAPVPLAACFPAAYFGLDRVPAFRDAADHVQQNIVTDCTRATLSEAYFIEKAGVSYAAKMVLLAPTSEERSLYATFAAEEAAHLEGMRAALGPSADLADWSSDPFLTWLGTIVEQSDRHTSQLVVQVVLEGWGLHHYAGMREACQHPGLRDLFARILSDEAGHHGSGVVLLRDVVLPPEALARATDLLADLLSMVQVGPALVVGALERGLGGFSPAQRAEALRALDAARHVRQRLSLLRSCLAKVPASAPIVAALQERGGFSVPQEAV